MPDQILTKELEEIRDRIQKAQLPQDLSQQIEKQLDHLSLMA